MQSGSEFKDGPIRSILEESKELGFLGPGPVESHIDHSLAFLSLISDHSKIMDLGSGGGVPGLVLAQALFATGASANRSLTLVDASRRRCEFLSSAVARMGLSEHVLVEHGRAEELARRPDLRHQFDCVVARSFGAPAVVAECAVGFIRRGGQLIVSEPPRDRDEHWDKEGLALLGMEASGRVEHHGFGLQIISVVEPCDERYPRRNGVPAKRPLF